MKIKRPKKFGQRAPALKMQPFKPIKAIKSPKVGGGGSAVGGRRRKNPFS